MPEKGLENLRCETWCCCLCPMLSSIASVSDEIFEDERLWRFFSPS